MLKKLLLLNFRDDTLEPRFWERLRATSESVITLAADAPDLGEHLVEADGLLLKLGMGADRALIDSAPSLRYIGMLGTGYGRIEAAYAASRGVAVTNVADYSTEGVAEFVFCVLLAQLRELDRARHQADQGNYSEDGFSGSEIRGKTFGVVGLGNIGRRVADIAAHAFAADTIYWSRTQKDLGPASPIRYVDRAELLSTADIVSLHLEYNPGTEGLIDRAAIEAFRPGAVVINTAPMELVDIPALDERLAKGDITFILDHADELSEADAARLARHENCVIYPPIAYTTDEATAAKQDIFVGNLEGFLAGSPRNKVN